MRHPCTARLFFVLAAASLIGCDGDPVDPDAGAPDASGPDAGPTVTIECASPELGDTVVANEGDTLTFAALVTGASTVRVAGVEVSPDATGRVEADHVARFGVNTIPIEAIDPAP